ncbi:hypothetical protein [Microbacterium oxydans]|uniref:Uncharacterized protein n=1 Tax=Microbacterium oxydans TaxID=82380 RepID=A0A0F0LLN8_9MICO|nr:hypothetical protein [Microbacterium oxydans]KJL33609.1 hypothetical protein RS83_00076 [Microbacterium oxydans]
MPEITRSTPTGPSRRTILKASAWSLPVVAVAAAVPLAAASTAIDLELTAQPFGNRIIVTNPEGTLTFDVTIPYTFDATTFGATATSGATLLLSFDIRLLDDVSVTMLGEPAIQLTSELTGNTRTVTFALPIAIPADGTTAPIQPFFATVNSSTFVSDLAPLVVTLVAPAGSGESDLSNNAVTTAVQYVAPPN